MKLRSSRVTRFSDFARNRANFQTRSFRQTWFNRSGVGVAERQRTLKSPSGRWAQEQGQENRVEKGVPDDGAPESNRPRFPTACGRAADLADLPGSSAYILRVANSLP